jgi:hypothetical protein
VLCLDANFVMQVPDFDDLLRVFAGDLLLSNGCRVAGMCFEALQEGEVVIANPSVQLWKQPSMHLAVSYGSLGAIRRLLGRSF